MLHRCLLLSFLMISISACTTIPLPPADFSSPTATLGTFQGAFASDEAGADDLGYACFSQEFKDQNGHFDLEQYAMFRWEALETSPFLSLLISLKDLSECIDSVEQNFGGNEDLALMKLSVVGQDLDILFKRETVCLLEFDSTTDKEKHVPSLAETLHVDGTTLLIRVDGLEKAWIGKLPYLRRLVLEEQWKFRDVKILEYGRPTPQL